MWPAVWAGDTFLLPDSQRDAAPGPCAGGYTHRKGAVPLRAYELVFVTQPGLDEEGLTGLVERVKETMTTNGGEVLKAEHMGKRHLAYPIGRHHEGHYVLVEANLERPAITAVERDLRLSEDVLRHLLVRLDED